MLLYWEPKCPKNSNPKNRNQPIFLQTIRQYYSTSLQYIKILRITDKNQWHYVPTKENPADMLTKIDNIDIATWLEREVSSGTDILSILPWECEQLMIDDIILEEIRKEQSVWLTEKNKNKLDVIQKDGMFYIRIRCFDPNTENHKILLSNKMKISEKIAKLMHEKGHGSSDLLRTNLRKQFWVIGEAELCKRVYNACEQCKLYCKNLSFCIPNNDPIQEQQILQIMSNIGLDHAGPILNYMNEKRYILLIICLSTKI